MDTMGERLRAARIAAGFDSATAAAAFHGWTPSTYTAHENGQNGFKVKQAVVYARAFKVSPEWLQFGANPPPPDAQSIDAQLRELPQDVSRALIQRFNAMIEGVRVVEKLK